MGLKQPFHLVVSGGIGDLVMALPVIEALKLRVEDDYDIFLFSSFPEIMSHFLPKENVRSIREFKGMMHSLDWYLHLGDVPMFTFKRADLSFPLSLSEIVGAWTHHYQTWGPLIDGWPNSSHLIAQKAVSTGIHRSRLCGTLLGLKTFDFYYEPLEIKDLPIKIDGPFITIHDGFDTTNHVSGAFSTKNWPLYHWIEVLKQLKTLFPEVKILQLGSSRSRNIPETHENLAGKLSFPESTALLAKAVCHIDGDSGLVHARHLFNKPSVVLWGPTSPQYYAYAENENVGSGICSPCWWVRDAKWIDKCIFQRPEVTQHSPCMVGINPDQVVKAATSIIELGLNKLLSPF